MSEPVLLVRARRLRAARGVVVARDVTLDAAPGEVVAVEGPNGSGKSTLLAAAAGLLPADNASVRPGSVGYSPERAGILPRIPLQRWLLGLARTAGLGREESSRRAGDLLARLGLAHAAAMSLHALSRGNAQRALVAQALLADPDLLVLDEPAGGMDADGVSRVAFEIRRAVVLALAALVAPLLSQGSHPHPLMLDVRIVGLHLAAAVFGAGLGSLLALMERAGWRLLIAVTVFFVLFVVRDTPMGPLLRLSTHPTTLQTTVGGPAAWLFLPGLALVAVAAFLATRLT